MKRNALARSLAFSLSIAALGLLGCAAPLEDEEAALASSEGELRTLGSDEIVGSIDFGASQVEVVHPGETKSRRVYRAWRVEANRGDVIEARAVAGNAADPVLYVLGSDFRTLKSNDDEKPGEKSSLVSYRASRSGTYYLALRTKEGWRTKLYVSLAERGGATSPPIVPMSTLDPFAATTARELTEAEVAGLFAPGASSRALGTFHVFERRRACNELTGCGAFKASAMLHQLAGNIVYPSTSWRPEIADGAQFGATSLVTTREGVRLQLGLKGSELWIGPCRLAQTTPTCRALTQKSACSLGGTDCTPREVGVRVLDNPASSLAFDVKLTADFVVGRSPVYRSEVSSSGAFTEAQYAFVASANGKNQSFEPAGETMTVRFE